MADQAPFKLPPQFANFPFIPLKRASPDDWVNKSRQTNQQDTISSTMDNSTHQGNPSEHPAIGPGNENRAQSLSSWSAGTHRPCSYPDPYTLIQTSHLTHQSTQLSKIVVSAMEDIQTKQKQLDDTVKSTATRLDKLEKGLGTLLGKFARLIDAEEGKKIKKRSMEEEALARMTTMMEAMEGRVKNCESLMQKMLERMEEYPEKLDQKEINAAAELVAEGSESQTVQVISKENVPKTPPVSKKRKIMEDEDVGVTDDDEWLKEWVEQVEVIETASCPRPESFKGNQTESIPQNFELPAMDNENVEMIHVHKQEEVNPIITAPSASFQDNEDSNQQESGALKGTKRKLLSTQELDGEGASEEDEIWEGL